MSAFANLKWLLVIEKHHLEKYKTLYDRALSDVVKADKQIDLMARAFKQDDVRTVEEIKQYFAGLVEKE